MNDRRFQIKFNERNASFNLNFNEVQVATDGGYERGYEVGYEKGSTEGYTKGHADGVERGYKDGYADGVTAGHEAGYAEGLAARTYEVWTITLTDGTVVEKEVALL